MRSPLDDACDILDEFEKDVAKVQASWKEIAELNPDFEQVSPENWQEKRLEDSATISLNHSDQIQGIISLNRHHSQKKEELEILGSNGVLVITPNQ